jgi:hypothetical protein
MKITAVLGWVAMVGVTLVAGTEAPAAAGDLTPDEQLMGIIGKSQYNCSPDLIDQKLRNGADPGSLNADASVGLRVGDNALVSALRRPCSEKAVKSLVSGKIGTLNKLDVKKADPDVPGVDGVLPIVLAVRRDDPGLVKLLMKAGADSKKKMVSSDPSLNGKSAFDFLAGKQKERRMRKFLNKEWD